MQLFVGGYLKAAINITAGSSLYYNAADTVIVGGQSTGTSRSMNAYIDECRFTNGSANLVANRAYADPGAAFIL